MILSRAAKAALLCAFALAWISTWSQMRASMLADAREACWLEGEEIEHSQKVQYIWCAAVVPGLSLEPAPDFASLVEISIAGVDGQLSVAAPKRGPPSIDS